MSMSALLSALRSAGRRQVSASTIGIRQATGSHVLRIDGFTQLRKTAANGVDVRSGTFNVGGHDWLLLCYPNGHVGQYEGSHISIYLEHASHGRTGDATAKAQLSILDQAWKPCCTRDIEEHRFSSTTGYGWGEADFVKHEDLDKEKHLKDGCLTVLCDVTVTEHHTDDHVEVADPAAAPFDGQLAQAMWNVKKVDVKIEVGGETFPTHRWVLEAQSPVFKTELSLALTADGSTKLRVDDMDAKVFKALLRFMYTDSPPEASQLEEPTMAEKLLVAADRYKLEKLKQVCEESLRRRIGMNSVAATLAFAERHHNSVLEAACMKFLSSPGNLEEFLATGGLEQIKKGRCPIALLRLVGKRMMIERGEQNDHVPAGRQPRY